MSDGELRKWEEKAEKRRQRADGLGDELSVGVSGVRSEEVGGIRMLGDHGGWGGAITNRLRVGRWRNAYITLIG